MKTPDETTLVRVARNAIFSNQLQVYLAYRSPGGRIRLPEVMTLKEAEPGTAANPTFELTEDTAQRLMDELWDHGLRPTEGHGSTGQIAAVEKHRDHLAQLLSQTLTTVCNVVNTPLLAEARKAVPADKP